MIQFPKLNTSSEPPLRKMSGKDYLAFCDFCIRNNPSITPENCLARKSGEEAIKTPFFI
ncbi:MAG: hypothetical protein V3V05_10615 [Pontiella sp.]